jgi:hypothetical protein
VDSSPHVAVPAQQATPDPTGPQAVGLVAELPDSLVGQEGNHRIHDL